MSIRLTWVAQIKDIMKQWKLEKGDTHKRTSSLYILYSIESLDLQGLFCDNAA